MLNSPESLPDLHKIPVRSIEKTIKHLIKNCKQAVKKALSNNAFTWENTVLPINIAEDALHFFWAQIEHLNSVKNTSQFRNVYNKCLPIITDYFTYMGQNLELCKAYKKIKQIKGLSLAQTKVIDDALCDFHLSGVDLPLAKKREFKKIEQQLSLLANKFSNNVLDSTKAFEYYTDDPKDLDGLPNHAIDAAKQKCAKRPGYALGLDFPTYHAVITYANNRQLREQFYHAYTTRASDQSPIFAKYNNTKIIAEILKLRHRLAQLIGFENYADYSIATKMAQTSDQVVEFLENLSTKAKNLANGELTELKTFAAEKYGIKDIKAWDFSYYSEKLKQAKFNLSSEEIRSYFPLPKVLDGMFAIAHKLFGITVVEIFKTRRYHRDVRLFRVFDEDFNYRGAFYMDLFARKNKRGGAWMHECRSRWKNKTTIYPIAFLSCNFTPINPKKPNGLTHDEVITLFHEFGHTIHHLLSLVDYPDISGTNGVEWDAVELPSQFMENFCWEKETIDMISEHNITHEKLPEDKLTNLLAMKKFQAAAGLLRQMEFSLFDFMLHKNYNPENPRSAQSVLDEIRNQVAIIKPPIFNRFQNSFLHIFAGGYAAGYYSYKWAEVLSADAFSRFKKEGILNTQVGREFLHKILEKGGESDAIDLFKSFMSRDPKIDALLEELQ